MRKIGIGLGITLVIGLALVLFIGNTSGTNNPIEEVSSEKVQETEDIGLTQEEVEEGLDLQTNGADGTYVVNLLSGSLEGEVEGVVQTDTDCAADEEGISRCHNEIELDEQRKVIIANPHNMQKNRCLSPGETVHLSRNEDGKVIVEVSEI